MKKLIAFITTLLFFVAGGFSQKVGIGTVTPENTLHIFKGSAGAVTAHIQAPLIVENSTSCYVHVLAPDVNESGIVFGNPASYVSSGLFYNRIGTPNGFVFTTNGNITRMVLTDEGRLAVGTASPGNYKLKVSHSASDFGFAIENSTTLENWGFVNQGTLQLYFNENFRGSFNSTTGAYTAGSDERLKTNIKPMAAILDKINQLKPSTYQFKNTTDKQEYNGFIAQDVLKIFPGMITHNVNPEHQLDIYTMDYSGFGVIAVKGIQELQPIIEEHQKTNEQQKLKIAMLEGRLAKLEAAFATMTKNRRISR